jgi:hypothetical protein
MWIGGKSTRSTGQSTSDILLACRVASSQEGSQSHRFFPVATWTHVDHRPDPLRKTGDGPFTLYVPKIVYHGMVIVSVGLPGTREIISRRSKRAD